MAARKKPRTAAQKAATRKLVAANRARRKVGTAKKRVVRHSNPIAIHHAAPKRKRRSVAKHHGHHTVARRRRRNPISGGLMRNMVMPAVTAASGALALDVLWGYAPIPANFKTGNLQYVAKAAGALLIGWAGSKVMKKSTAEAMAVGALTVVVHDAAKMLIATTMPSLHLGMVNSGYPAGTFENVGEYVNGVGEYVSGSDGEYVGAMDSDNAYNVYY